jgi:hypothetical protein
VHVFLRVRDFGGYKVPLRAGAVLELWDEQHRLCLELDAAVILDLLHVEIRRARLAGILSAAAHNPLALERLDFTLSPPESHVLEAPAAPRKPLARAGSTTNDRMSRRQERRARRKA